MFSRSFTTHCLALAFVAASWFGLYNVKYQVQDVHSKVAAAQAQLLEERRAMQVVAAEWAYLSRPDRLAQLNEKYLAGAPVNSKQVSEVASLPYPSNTQFASAQMVAPSAGTMAVSYRVPTQPMPSVPADAERLMVEE